MPAPRDVPSSGRVVPLPPATAAGAPLGRTIENRRSRRSWQARGMTPQELSSVLFYSFGQSDGRPDPSIEENHALRVYLIILNVDGIAPGLYVYLREPHALSLLKKGAFSERAYVGTLMQELARDPAALIVKTVDAARMECPDGARGYRYALMDAGMVGGQIYLQTEALGLGTCGIGGYLDDDFSRLCGLDPDREHVVYISAIGAPER